MFFIKRALLVLQIMLGAGALLFFTSFKANSPYQIEKKIFIPQSQLEQSRYFYVPFEVPKGANRIAVSYDYNSLGGTNVVDIGVFDARFSGTDADPKGFRGWSGGKRSEFFIERNDSTPGYLAGDLTPGTWRVILGLYKVAPQGVEVNLKFQILDDSNPFSKLQLGGGLQTPPATKQQAQTRTPGWFRGDLHLHTLHSDGDWTLPALLAKAQENGLDFVGVTEHNTPTHHFEIDRIAKNYAPLLVMRGEEVTTYGGHFNVWGLPSGEWIDFRVRGGDSQSIAKLVAQTHHAGALASINHPFAPCFGCDWSYDFENTKFDSIEVWNGAWDVTDEAALKKWDESLQKGIRLTAIGSSDFHRPPALIGLPTTQVNAASLNQKDILAAVKNGKVIVTQKPNFALTFTAQSTRIGVGDEIKLKKPAQVNFNVAATDFPADAKFIVVANGKSVREISDKEINSTTTVNFERDGYARLEVRGANNALLAFTNPIYIKIK